MVDMNCPDKELHLAWHTGQSDGILQDRLAAGNCDQVTKLALLIVIKADREEDTVLLSMFSRSAFANGQWYS